MSHTISVLEESGSRKVPLSITRYAGPEGPCIQLTAPSEEGTVQYVQLSVKDLWALFDLFTRERILPQHPDTVRMNRLQEAMVGYGRGWILRISDQGRGLRLHETTRPGAVPDVRKAVDDFFQGLSREVR